MSERRLSSEVLTSGQQARLAVVKKAQEEAGKNHAESLPLVGEATCEGLRHRLNMGDDGQTENSKEEYPFCIMRDMAQDYLRTFSQDKEGTGTKSMYYQAATWLDKTFPSDNDGNCMSQDAVKTGMFLVFIAFDMQHEMKLPERLRKIEPKKVMEAFDRQKAQAGDSSLVGKIRSEAGFPTDQVHLGKLINKFVKYYSIRIETQVMTGVNLGFGVIKELWPELKIGS